MDQRRTSRALLFVVGLLSILLVNQLANRYRWLVDFTEEGRYTLHPATQAVLEKLEQPVYITVYLDGELPANFKRLQKSIRETLEQFTVYAGSNLQYRFVDPSIAKSTTARNQYFRSLIDKGLQPSNVTYNKDGNKTERLIFPGATITYGGREIAVNLLKSNRSLGIDEMLNQSVEALEYEITQGLYQLQKTRNYRVGLLLGHGEPDTSLLAGLTNTILQKHEFYRINLVDRDRPITGYDALIIAKPQTAFTEKEKYRIDQFVMGGGTLMLFMDALSVDLREADGEGTVAIPVETNLDDLLFKYGVRINRDYVADANCGNTPVVSGMVGNQPRIELLPWPYAPIVTNYADHPIVKNLDATWMRHVSTIDTVKAVGIRKTSLMRTSEFTRVFGPPVRVSYNDLRDKLRPEYFTAGVKNVSYLLEGKFNSLFQNRILPRGVDRRNFIEKGRPAKVIVVSDGDFIRNDFDLESDQPLEMGVDPYSQASYANGAFVMQVLDYAFDADGLMLAKNKEVMIRPLDKVKLERSADFYRWLNLLLPISLILAFGVVRYLSRRRKFAVHG
ncbi:MAG: gliding motility-associated ABC transporter substrate-binding protein GldG [Cyclobacteriaceae bacterium]